MPETTIYVRRDVTDLNVRDEPYTSASIDRVVHAGDALIAKCYTEGENVTAFGVTNNIWIQIGSWYDDEYVWAGGLEGVEYGGVPNHC